MMTIRFFVSAVTMAIAMAVSVTANARQCPTCGPCGDFSCTTGTCTVNCLSELQSALACVGSGMCSRIVIPCNCTIDVPSTIGINSSMNGLYLEIRGTVRWTGAQSGSTEIFNVVGCQNVTFDGVSTGGSRELTAVSSLRHTIQRTPHLELREVSTSRTLRSLLLPIPRSSPTTSSSRISDSRAFRVWPTLQTSHRT